MTGKRTESARDHDDSAIIDQATKTPSAAGSAGGNLQRDVASQAELDSVDDPEGHERVTKQDAIDNDTAYPSDRHRA